MRAKKATKSNRRRVFTSSSSSEETNPLAASSSLSLRLSLSHLEQQLLGKVVDIHFLIRAPNERGERRRRDRSGAGSERDGSGAACGGACRRPHGDYGAGRSGLLEGRLPGAEGRGGGGSGGGSRGTAAGAAAGAGRGHGKGGGGRVRRRGREKEVEEVLSFSEKAKSETKEEEKENKNSHDAAPSSILLLSLFSLFLSRKGTSESASPPRTHTNTHQRCPRDPGIGAGAPEEQGPQRQPRAPSKIHWWQRRLQTTKTPRRRSPTRGQSSSNSIDREKMKAMTAQRREPAKQLAPRQRRRRRAPVLSKKRRRRQRPHRPLRLFPTSSRRSRRLSSHRSSTWPQARPSSSVGWPAPCRSTSPSRAGKN